MDSSQQQSVEVQKKDDRLKLWKSVNLVTINCKDTPFPDVLKELGRQSEMMFKIENLAPESAAKKLVTLNTSKVPLIEVLCQLATKCEASLTIVRDLNVAAFGFYPPDAKYESVIRQYQRMGPVAIGINISNELFEMEGKSVTTAYLRAFFFPEEAKMREGIRNVYLRLESGEKISLDSDIVKARGVYEGKRYVIIPDSIVNSRVTLCGEMDFEYFQNPEIISIEIPSKEMAIEKLGGIRLSSKFVSDSLIEFFLTWASNLTSDEQEKVDAILSRQRRADLLTQQEVEEYKAWLKERREKIRMLSSLSAELLNEEDKIIPWESWSKEEDISIVGKVRFKRNTKPKKLRLRIAEKFYSTQAFEFSNIFENAE